MALSLAASLQGQASTPDTVQKLAVTRGFTLQGEMFSARDMALLAGELLAKECSVEPSSRLLDTAWLLEVLGQGRLLLVPYDCAANHSPSLEGGSRAHWALVTGVAWPGMDGGGNISLRRGQVLEGCTGWVVNTSKPTPAQVKCMYI